MKTLHLKLLAVVALGALSATALAGEACTAVPKDKWMTADAVKAQLEQQGYQVKRIKTEDGCYEAYVHDKGGKRAELILNPADGKLVRQEGE